MRGCRGGNQDDGVILDMSTSAVVGERKLSPEFSATKLLENLYKMVTRASTHLCSKVPQLSSLSISVRLANFWYLPSVHRAARRCTISI